MKVLLLTRRILKSKRFYTWCFGMLLVYQHCQHWWGGRHLGFLSSKYIHLQYNEYNIHHKCHSYLIGPIALCIQNYYISKEFAGRLSDFSTIKSIFLRRSMYKKSRWVFKIWGILMCGESSKYTVSYHLAIKGLKLVGTRDFDKILDWRWKI